MYRSWVDAGYRVHVSLIYDDIKPEEWRDVEKDAFAYGRAFAEHFGPS